MREWCCSVGRFGVFFTVLLAGMPIAAHGPTFEDRVGASDPEAQSGPKATDVRSAPSRLLTAEVLPVSCTAVDFTATMTMLDAVGDILVGAAGDTAIVTAHGRYGIETLTSGTGAVFELRIDDAPPPAGKARPTVRQNEVGLFPAVPDSATGVFPGLSAGYHGLSIWVRGGGNGSGTNAMVDPGCWSTDHVVVEVYDGNPAQVLEVPYVTRGTVTMTPAKVADIGTFSVSGEASVVELTYNGRFSGGGFDPSCTGFIFELRVDDRPSLAGRAASYVLAEDPLHHGRSVEISAVFPELAAGSHTASVWVRGAWAGGIDAQMNPGGWHDQLMVVEHTSASGTLLEVPPCSGITVDQTMTKLADIGTFEVLGSGSVVEVVYNGRVGAETIAGTGVSYEIRVDDQASSHGRARATLKPSEVASLADIPAQMTGVFSGLAPGPHTVSLWARGWYGDATNVGFNRGGWPEHVLILEHGSGEIFSNSFELDGVAGWSGSTG